MAYRPEEIEEVVENGRRRRLIRHPDGTVTDVTDARDEVVVEEFASPTDQTVVQRVVSPAAEVVVEQPVRTRTVRRWLPRRPVVERNVVSTEYYNAPSYRHDPTVDQVVRALWFLLGLLEALLALRFVLALLGANPGNAFASLVYGLTGPFVAPFRTLFATPAAGGSVFELYTLVAMIVYLMLWWVLVRLIEVVTNRPVDV